MKKQNWTHGCHHLPEQEEPQPPDPVPILPGGGLSTDLAEVEYKLKQVEASWLFLRESGNATLS